MNSHAVTVSKKYKIISSKLYVLLLVIYVDGASILTYYSKQIDRET
jgi:hypothetical protein